MYHWWKGKGTRKFSLEKIQEGCEKFVIILKTHTQTWADCVLQEGRQDLESKQEEQFSFSNGARSLISN